jgi:hypothetical protein
MTYRVAVLRESRSSGGSRREGVCGSCATRVPSGAVEHRDSVLSAAEQMTGDCLMACVSRAAGPRLVLDL